MGAARSDAPAFLGIARRLGREIADSAIWYDGRCNWLGALSSDEIRLTGRPVVAALGPDLYGGTSGVALFLAEAGTKLDDDRLRRTALGAIRLALDDADRGDPNAPDGLYEGRIGIAYAAARVAELLGADDVHTRARELLVQWRRDDTRSRLSDLMGGCSGAVAGLVALCGLVAEPSLVDAAVQLGDELIARADATTTGWSWGDPGQRSMHNLCGYAHGAAGVGHAFTELFALTGEARFREAAVHAFDYERSWLDPRTGTWPDLRDVVRRAGRDAPAPAAETWCNGAPGIALSRIRAAELLRSATLRDDADLALAACERYVAELLVRAPDDFCLCHGASGAADVLLHGGAGSAKLAAELGLHGMDLHAGPGAVRFPCGVPLGETPGLLLGFGGIGMFYLRLHDSDVPSPLLIHAPAVDTRSTRPVESTLPGERRVP